VDLAPELLMQYKDSLERLEGQRVFNQSTRNLNLF